MTEGTVTRTLISSNVSQTVAIGKRLGKALKPGDVVALTGELGSGKTVLTKGLAAGLGFEQQDEVRSPSYKLLNQYAGCVIINHFDAYRLKGAGDFADIGGEDLLGRHSVSIIEWARRIAQALPERTIWISIKVLSESRRRLEFSLPEQRAELVFVFGEGEA